MPKYNIAFNYSLEYRGKCIFFKKIFELNYIPFNGLRFRDGGGDDFVEIEISEYNGGVCDQHLYTSYETENEFFYFTVRVYWKSTPSIDHVNHLVSGFRKFGWDMPNDTDVQGFLKLVEDNQLPNDYV